MPGSYVAYSRIAMEKTGSILKELESVVSEHPTLISRILRVSENLVRHDLSGALGQLEGFRRAIRRHADIEEDLFLPVYRDLDNIPRTGRAEFFVDEHRRIDSTLDSLVIELQGLSSETATDAGIVSLVEQLGRFRNLIDHHFRREEMTLYPRLREALE